MKGMASTPADTARRRLLWQGSLAVPAAAVAAASLPPLQPARSQASAEGAATAPEPSGYHLSEHIRRYYALARF